MPGRTAPWWYGVELFVRIYVSSNSLHVLCLKKNLRRGLGGRECGGRGREGGERARAMMTVVAWGVEVVVGLIEIRGRSRTIRTTRRPLPTCTARPSPARRVKGCVWGGARIGLVE